MIETLNAILPYITGLWTLPWILIGFIVTLLLSRIFGESNVDKVMKKIHEAGILWRKMKL